MPNTTLRLSRPPFHAWSSLWAMLGGAALAVACSSGSPVAPSPDAGTDAGPSSDAGPDAETGDDAGLTGIVTKPDGKTPSNFTCNHHFADPAAEASATHAFAVSIVANVVGMPAPPNGGTLSLIDPSTGATTGMPSASIDATGVASLALAGNTRAAWKVSALGSVCDPCIDSYEFNRLVGPDATATTAPLPTTVFEIDHAAGWGEASGFLAHQYLLGTILDCDGDPVMNASIVVAGAALCQSPGTGTDAVCFVFPQSKTNPSSFYTSTGAVGQFLVYTQTPAPVSVQAIGRLSPSDASPSVIGTLDALMVDGSLSLGTTSPLSK